MVAKQDLATICRSGRPLSLRGQPRADGVRQCRCHRVEGRRSLLISFTAETTAARRSGIENASINLRHIGHQPAATTQKRRFSVSRHPAGATPPRRAAPFHGMAINQDHQVTCLVFSPAWRNAENGEDLSSIPCSLLSLLPGCPGSPVEKLPPGNLSRARPVENLTNATKQSEKFSKIIGI